MKLSKLTFIRVTGALFFILSILWIWQEYKNPYLDSFFYRTFLQRGFNTEITVELEFDNKAYTVQRIIRCRRFQTSGEWAGKSYSFFPDYQSFGTTASTGEGIILTTPAVCGMRDNRFYENKDWQVPVPENYLPLAAISDTAVEPKMITVYASRQAYKSPLARLKIVSIKINSPTVLNRSVFAADGRDDFSFFGSLHEFENYVADQEATLKKPTEEWFHLTFVAIPKEIWSSEDNGLHLNNTTISLLNNAKVQTYLSLSQTLPIEHPDLHERNRKFSMNLPLLGHGVLPGPLLSGSKSERISDTMYFDEMIPYRLNQDVWERDDNSRGMILLFKPHTMKDNLKASVLIDTQGKKWNFAREIKLENDILTYHENPKTSFLPRAPIYIPKSSNIYYPIPWRFEFIKNE